MEERKLGRAASEDIEASSCQDVGQDVTRIVVAIGESGTHRHPFEPRKVKVERKGLVLRIDPDGLHDLWQRRQ